MVSACLGPKVIPLSSVHCTIKSWTIFQSFLPHYNSYLLNDLQSWILVLIFALTLFDLKNRPLYETVICGIVKLEKFDFIKIISDPIKRYPLYFYLSFWFEENIQRDKYANRQTNKEIKKFMMMSFRVSKWQTQIIRDNLNLRYLNQIIIKLKNWS